MTTAVMVVTLPFTVVVVVTILPFGSVVVTGNPVSDDPAVDVIAGGGLLTTLGTTGILPSELLLTAAMSGAPE